MMKKGKREHTEKAQTTYEEFVDSLSPKEKKEFETEYKDLLLSELLLAIMAQDEISVRSLAKAASISPTVIQAMRHGVKKDFSMKSFFKILKGLGFEKLTVERDGQAYSLNIPDLRK